MGKIVLIVNGAPTEVSLQKLQEYESNPKYKVVLVEDKDGVMTYKLLEYLVD